jgi:hypothetical protein
MAEYLELSTPSVIPEVVTSTYRVVTLALTWYPNAAAQSSVAIGLQDEHGGPFTHIYTGQPAVDLMKWLNTANFSTTSMHKRILQKLSNEGVLPGTVVGTPEPAPPAP